MTVAIAWGKKPRKLTCAVCTFSGRGTHIATVTGASSLPLEVSSCPQCDSVTIDGEMFDLDLTDADIDRYIENGVSVDAITTSLLAVDPTSVKRFLDVGCNYGFGVHVARELLGWHAEGIEPGNLGVRGAAELGITIHNAFLTKDSDLGAPFDLVLASEVLEHVPDPLELLVAMRAALAQDGRLILTTPAAEVIDKSEPIAEIIGALGPGVHRFLTSAKGLEQLLREAGFASAVVVRDRGTLRALASVKAETDLAWGSYDIPGGSLEGYYGRTAKTAPSGSALESGMASREFRSIVNQGAFDRAPASFARAARASAGRSGVELTDPAIPRAALDAGEPVPSTLISIAYHAGMMEFLGHGNHTRAIEWFDLVIAAIPRWIDQVIVLDGDSADLLVNALRHRALCMVWASPDSVPVALELLGETDTGASTDQWTLKIFVDLVNVGAFTAARVLATEVAELIDVAPRDSAISTAPAGPRAMAALGFLELQTGSPIAAQEAFARAIAQLDLVESSQGATEPGVRLREEIAKHSQKAESISQELRWADSDPEILGAVSVIVPLYNGAQFVRDALMSVLAQDRLPLEIIVVDDGSVDGSMRIVHEVASDVPIVTISQANAGQSSARNVGVRAARGEYVAFLDQDDVWHHDHLSLLVPLLEENRNVAWAFSDFDQIDGEGHTVTHHFLEETGVVNPKRSLVDVVSKDLMVLPTASVIRRRAILEANGFDTRLIGYEDDDLFVKIYRRGWTHAFEPTSTARYRVHSRGASATPAFLKSRLTFLDTLLESIPDDHRTDFYPSQDHIIPRFYKATQRDFLDALAFRDWPRAVATLSALREIARKVNRLQFRRKVELWAMKHPQSLRRALLAAGALPGWMVPKRVRNLNFGQRSVIRSGRADKS